MISCTAVWKIMCHSRVINRHLYSQLLQSYWIENILEHSMNWHVIDWLVERVAITATIVKTISIEVHEEYHWISILTHFDLSHCISYCTMILMSIHVIHVNSCNSLFHERCHEMMSKAFQKMSWKILEVFNGYQNF
jgi:hypothetical protein